MAIVRTIAVANQKGGVGKTAVTHALGELLASAGRRVLLIDMDPQASLTASCGVLEPRFTVYGVLLENKPLPLVTVPIKDNLDLAPADITLSAAEMLLGAKYGRESKLSRALAAVRGYDVALIDCPPSLGLLTVNALVAAHGVLVPVLPQLPDIRGTALLLDTVEQIRDELNPRIDILGILATQFDGRLLHHGEALDVMRSKGWPVLPFTVGRSIRVSEAAATGGSIVSYDPANPRSAELEQLAKEVKQWLENQ